MAIVEKVFQYCGVSPPSARTYVIQMFDTRSGAERAYYTQSGEFGRLLGFSPDGRTLWTEMNDAGTVTICGWDTVSPGPPVWLPVTTGFGLLVIIADWRRGRRQQIATITWP
jgi:hypothetical protein